MEERLQKRDFVFIAACSAVALVCLFIGAHYFYRAFPEASIDFRVTREEARQRAELFLQERGFDVSSYRHSAVFRYDNRAKTFLERELGLEGATQAIGKTVRLWRWNHRWVRERQQEEFRVDITTEGQLAGFRRELPEAQAGAKLDETAARRLAETFLIETMDRDLGTLDFVEASSVEREARTDHDFIWKLSNFSPSEASYRLRIHIQGDQIGGFAEYLKVPEAWQRDFDELRSHNQATGLVASSFLLLTLLAMLVTFFHAVRGHDIRWKTATAFAAIAFVLTLLANLNNLPLSAHSYDTTDTYLSFVAGQLFAALLTALLQGLFIFFLTAAAEPLYRRHYPQQISISAQFLFSGLRSKRFLLGCILGLAMTAFFFAYQTLFYIAAEDLGAWSPAQIPYSEMVNTYIPWVVVLLIGFMPAVSEEFMSRAFSIPFLHKYLKSPTAAVIIAALIWGFAHAGYPQQPFYIRGLEVGLAGVIIGFVFLRWGLLAPLVWHYTVDALYTALILLRSSNSYFVISAAISVFLVLLPLLAAIVLYWRRGCFSDPTPLLNGAEESANISLGRNAGGSTAEASDISHSITAQATLSAAPAQVEPSTAPLQMKQPTISAPAPFSKHLRLPAALLCAGSLLIFTVETERPLNFVDYSLTADQARERAAAHLSAQGIDPTSYRSVAYQQNQPDHEAMIYMLKHGDSEQINRLYSQDLAASLWAVRFFRYGEKEEYRVAVHPGDGSIYSQRHLVAEEAPGADLDETQARGVAEDHLLSYGLDPQALEVVESSAEKRPKRTDHRLVFQARVGDPRNTHELHYRVSVNIAGDQPAGLYRHFKVPEAWSRARDEDSFFKTACTGLLTAAVLALVLYPLWLLVCLVRDDKVQWRPAARLGAIGALFFLLSFCNDLITVERAYDTRLSAYIFVIMQSLSAVFAVFGIGLSLCVAIVLASGFFPNWRSLLRAATSPSAFGDAVLRALLFLAATASVNRLYVLAKSTLMTYAASPDYALPTGLDSYFPFVGALAHATLAAIVIPLVLATVIYYDRHFLHSKGKRVLAALVFVVVLSGNRSHDAGEFAFVFISTLYHITAYAVLGYYLLRNHLLAYCLAAFFAVIASRASSWLFLSAPFYALHGVALLLAAIMCIIYLWHRARRERLF